MKHSHYRIHAFDKEDKDFKLLNVSEITVRAKNEKEAIEIAKTMLVRPHYRIKEVWECHTDHELEQNIKMIQLEIQSKMYKLMKP